MTLKIYNTLSQKKEDFVPITPGQIKMYVCGPTVYDYLHIGNFRGAIHFNLVRHWFEHIGYKVTFVYNYTDVDDKIINRAKEEGVKAEDISNKYILEFQKDFQRLGLTPHEYNPKVTETIPEIIQVIEELIKKEKAYEISGEVFYSIDSFNDYGKLSKKKLEDLNAGERVGIDDRKKNPLDFVLWKPSKEGEPTWDSPWGAGRPGWHIECTAMAKKFLGETFDIHGGGIDLIFPHHENEIAQAEGSYTDHFCHFWMHNNFINMNDEKMSKSLGNVMTARAFMDQYHPEILKYLFLSVHYRSQLNISEEKIFQVIAALDRVYSALERAQDLLSDDAISEGNPQDTFVKMLDSKDKEMAKDLNDDFNSGALISHIFEVVRSFNSINLTKKKTQPQAKATAKNFISWIKKYGQMTSLFNQDPHTILTELDDIILAKRNLKRVDIDELIEKRNTARKNKDFAVSDEIRNKLVEWGIEVFDGGKRLWTVKKEMKE